MQKNKPNSFSENDLDKLLNRSFLESENAKPGNEKILESISAHIFGLKVATNEQSLSQKLIRKISFNSLIWSVLVIAGLSTGILLLKGHAAGTSRKGSDSPKVQIPATSGQVYKINRTEETATTKNTSANIHTDLYKKSSFQNYSEARLANNDSSTDNLVIMQPEVIHYTDPPLILPKPTDSIHLNTEQTEKNTIKNDKLTRKKEKGKWREHEVK
jgi:hypothetical protein